MQLSRPCSNCLASYRLTPRLHAAFGAALCQVRFLSGPYGYTQAKALVYSKHGNPQDVIRLHNYSIPPPHSSLVTLRNLSTPLNPADINQIQGTYASLPTLDDRTSLSYGISTSEPSAVPGNEACFEVSAVGSGVKTLRKGDWVIPRQTGFGTWRTHAQVEEDRVTVLVPAREGKPLSQSRSTSNSNSKSKSESESVTANQVATVSVNPVTAYRMLEEFLVRPLEGQGKPSRGSWYIQNGANSAVGRMAIQLGRQVWGLKCIAVIRAREPGPDQAERDAQLRQELLDLGAEKVITDRELMQRDFPATVKAWLDADGVSSIELGLNCVGGEPTLAMAKVLSSGANLVTYGGMNKTPLRIPIGMLIFKDINFRGFWVSRWSNKHPEAKEKVMKEILQLYRDKLIVDAPVAEVAWTWETPESDLVGAVQQTLDGYRSGKGIFTFRDT